MQEFAQYTNLIFSQTELRASLSECKQAVFILPVFRSSLTVLCLISRPVLISSRPQTPLLQANLVKSGMLSNAGRLCAHFFYHHFTRQTLHAFLYFHTALEFVRILQIIRTTCTTFAPIEEPEISKH